MRTVSRVQSDQPISDMTIPLSAPGDIVQVIVAAETTKIIRIAAGEYSFRTQTASVAYTFAGSISGLIFRAGIQDDYQQQFGSARAGGSQGLPVGWPQTLSTASVVAGSPVNIAVLSSVNFSVGSFVTVDTVGSGVQEFQQITAVPDATHITVGTLANAHTTPFPITQNLFTTSGPKIGRPPFTGLTQLTPQTSAPSKGINVKQVTVVYAVNTTAITVPTVGVFATQFVHVTAPTVTTLIAQATNGLATAANAQPYAIPVPVPVANQGFIVTPNTIVTVEFDFTTAATGSVDVIGFVITGQYNHL